LATLVQHAQPQFSAERLFFTGMAGAMVLTTFVGFAPTYYLVSLFHGTTTRGVVDGEGLTPLVHLHGLTGSVWLLLLLAQTGLVAANRRDLHMRLGLAAIPVGAILAITAVYVALEAATRGSTPPGWKPAQFLLVQFGTLGGFVILATLGLLWRRRSAWHKRLMMLATIAMMVPVCGRIWIMLGLRPYARGAVGGMILADLFVLALVLFDLRARGRVHPATLWAGGFLIALQPSRVLLSGTEAWQAIGRSLISGA
jgi:hypothetical protein